MCVQRLATPGAEVVHRLLNTLKRPHDMESSQPHTCAHAHACATQTHTETESHANASPSLSPTRTLSLCCCQIKAWKAGHKGNCVAAARADTRTAAKPTADQMRVVKMLEQLAGAANWRGVAAQEGAARAVAAAVRTSMPSIASGVYSILGIAYYSLGDFSKAIDHHGLDLAIAKEVGDRAGEGRAYGNLGTGHMHLNEDVKVVAYFEAQHDLAISLKLAHAQSDAALNMGVALIVDVRAGRGPSTGADKTLGPPSHSSACLDDRVREAPKWLQAAFDGGRPFAKLHLAHLTFYAGQEDTQS